MKPPKDPPGGRPPLPSGYKRRKLVTRKLKGLPSVGSPVHADPFAIPPKLGIVRDAATPPPQPIGYDPTKEPYDPFADPDPLADPPGSSSPPPPPMPRVPDSRRCVLDDPFGTSMSLPITMIERQWNGRLRVVTFDIQAGRVLRRNEEPLCPADTGRDAELKAISTGGYILDEVQPSSVIGIIESTLNAAMTRVCRP
jgi:hypothetical protein